MNATSTFLGYDQLSKPVGGCRLALTGYAPEAPLEEWHAHVQASLSFLLSGTHREELAGRRLNRQPGEIKFIAAGQAHRCSHYAPDTRKINLDLSPATLYELGIGEAQIPALLGQSPQAKFTLLKLYHELAGADTTVPASAQLLLYELFFPRPQRPSTASRMPPAWVKVLTELLHDEWQDKFDLAELARKIGLHPVSLSRYFPQYFARTLGQYITRLKVEKALALIKGSGQSLTAIAYGCGFADQSHFTRSFKEVTGYLPGAFRKL